VARLLLSDDVRNTSDAELAIRATVAHGGEVVFVPAELLSEYAPIAADLRY
jgi:hypothetical protein